MHMDAFILFVTRALTNQQIRNERFAKLTQEHRISTRNAMMVPRFLTSKSVEIVEQIE